MKRFLVQILLIFSFSACLSCGAGGQKASNEQAQKINEESDFVTFIVNPNEANIELFWKDEQGNIFKNFQNLKDYVEKKGKQLRFAMNGGMYQEDYKPLGLFIQNQKLVTPLNTRDATTGNFYLKPNGVFYITTDNRAAVITTENFHNDAKIKFATQSGPMLIADGKINAEFQPNSENFNIRNGVCVLDDGRAVFVISSRAVNFYNFAAHFKNLGCRNALYLDGFVSRMYLPEKNVVQTDGDLGVLIGITE